MHSHQLRIIRGRYTFFESVDLGQLGVDHRQDIGVVLRVEQRDELCGLTIESELGEGDERLLQLRRF